MNTKQSEQQRVAELKQKVYEDFLETNNKTKTAANFNISTRTVGRYVAELSDKTAETIDLIDENDEESVISAPETEVVESTTEFKYFVIFDGSLINVTRIAVDGSQPPHSEICYKGSPRFEQAYEFYSEGKYEEVFIEISTKFRVEKLSHGKVECDPVLGKLVYDDGSTKFNFSSSLTTRVIDCITKGNDALRLMKFANFLSENPSKRAVDELHDFLLSMDIEITEEGMVRCFKRVRNNYTDVYTGKFDNSVGVTVTMPRHLVNDDSEVTCSHGLHVCSKAYLSHFGGERVLAVEVNPADFVSIPKDYYSIDENNVVKAKARVCKYVVVEDVTGQV